MSEVLECKIKGKVVVRLPLEQGTGAKGTWQKQSFIVETDGQYPKKVCLTAWGDKCDLIPDMSSTATFSFNVESREYNNRWYTELKIWKVEGEKKTTLSKEQKENAKTVVNKLDLTTTTEEDDLPF